MFWRVFAFTILVVPAGALIMFWPTALFVIMLAGALLAAKLTTDYPNHEGAQRSAHSHGNHIIVAFEQQLLRLRKSIANDVEHPVAPDPMSPVRD
jgi:hypothetical protein